MILESDSKMDNLSFENLKTYFEEIRLKPVSMEDYISTIKKYNEKYFYNNSEEISKNELKNIAHSIYYNFRSIAGRMYNKGELHNAMKFMQKMDLSVRLFSDKNAITKLEELDFNLMLAYMLYINNADFEAYIKCSTPTSEYFNSQKEVLKRIKCEEEKIKKSHSDLAMYYNNLICFSKFAQIICAKTGNKGEIGMHYWTEKYFEEKLCYLLEEISSVYQMIAAKQWVWESDVLQTLIVDNTPNRSRMQRLKKNMKMYLNALNLTFFRFISGYGEKPVRLLIASGIIIIIFGLLYSLRENQWSNSLEYIYRSLLVFFSFGFIDNFIKQDSINKVLFSTEIFLGIIFINGYIVTLARKLFR